MLLVIGVHDVLRQVRQHDSPRCRVIPYTGTQANVLPFVRNPNP